jgi:hypothetical protein
VRSEGGFKDTLVPAMRSPMMKPTSHSDGTSCADRSSGRAATAGGLAAIAAGVSWVVKGGTILATGIQLPLLFESAPVLMALAVLALSQELPHSRHRTVCRGAAGMALVFALPVPIGQLTMLPDVVTGIAIAAAILLTLLALGIGGINLRQQRGALLPLVLAVATIPALLVGGLLAMVAGERALEIPIVVLGLAWAALGLALLRRQYQPL